MNKRTILVISLVFLYFLLVSSCSEEITSVPTQKTGIETSVKVLPKRVIQGGDVEIEISIENHGPDTLSIEFSYWQRIGYRILTSKHDIIYYYPIH